MGLSLQGRLMCSPGYDDDLANSKILQAAAQLSYRPRADGSSFKVSVEDEAWSKDCNSRFHWLPPGRHWPLGVYLVLVSL